MKLLPLPVQSVEPWRPLRKVSMVKLMVNTDGCFGNIETHVS